MLISEDKQRLLSNFLSLLSLQGVNYILPLLTFPYLVKVLGVESFGLLAFATAVISYFNIITDYGFNLTATREISIHREDKEKVIEIFSAVMSIKIILMLISFLVLLILVFTFEKFFKDWEVYLLTFGTVIGQVLFPIWFFQGMEQMKYITYLNILAKVIFTVAIFVFVKEQNDYYLVPLFTSLGFTLAGILSLWFIYRNFDIHFKIQSVVLLKYYFVDGWDIFVSRIFVSLYTITNIIILGILTNNIVIGYYSIAEKIINAIGGIFIPINQTIYPYMAKIYSVNKNTFFKFFTKVSYVFLFISILFLGILLLYSNEIITFVVARHNTEIESIYMILAVTIITNPFGPFLTQTLIIQKLNREFKKIVKYTFIFNILISPIMIVLYGAQGLAFVVVISQVLVIYLCLKEFYRQKRNYKIGSYYLKLKG